MKIVFFILAFATIYGLVTLAIKTDRHNEKVFQEGRESAKRADSLEILLIEERALRQFDQQTIRMQERMLRMKDTLIINAYK